MPIIFRAAALASTLLAAVEAEAGAILDAANRIIPVDTATARDSGRVVRKDDTVTVTYGRDDDRNPKSGQPSNTYIVALHEDMETQHPRGGRAKFLETAANEAASGFASRVARRVGF